MVKGIGPVYGKKMVEKFGEEIFDIIENYSARLEEVEGIGPDAAAQGSKRPGAEQKVIRDNHGLPSIPNAASAPARAVRILTRPTARRAI